MLIFCTATRKRSSIVRANSSRGTTEHREKLYSEASYLSSVTWTK